MSEHEARSRAFYDHELEEPRPGGRHRRPAADWGVGDDIFDRMPSRRFARPERRAEQHRPEAPRRFERAERAERQIETWDEAAADAWGAEPLRYDEVAAAWSPEPEPGFTAVDARAGLAADADELRDAPLDGPAARDPYAYAEPPNIAANGRRTVVITGQPDRLPAPRAQRPPRTAGERVVARPDRFVGYAVALGMLLIVIALLTT